MDDQTTTIFVGLHTQISVDDNSVDIKLPRHAEVSADSQELVFPNCEVQYLTDEAGNLDRVVLQNIKNPRVPIEGLPPYD